MFLFLSSVRMYIIELTRGFTRICLGPLGSGVKRELQVLSPGLTWVHVWCKGIIPPKNYVTIKSLSYCSKPVYDSLFYDTQKKIF